MNLRKSVHILLAFLLCFGQLVAGAHVVGHLSLHKSVSQSPFAADHVHEHASLSAHDHSHGSFQAAANDTVDSNSAENDCAIYHTFLGLGGSFFENPGKQVAPASGCGLVSYSSSFRAHFLLEHTRIRAPPTFS